MAAVEGNDENETRTLLGTLATAAVLVVGIPAISGGVLLTWRPFDPVSDELAAILESDHSLALEASVSIPVTGHGVCISATGTSDALDSEGECPSGERYVFSYLQQEDIAQWKLEPMNDFRMGQVPLETASTIDDCIYALIDATHAYGGAFAEPVPSLRRGGLPGEVLIDDHLEAGGTFCFVTSSRSEYGLNGRYRSVYTGETVGWLHFPASGDKTPEQLDAHLLLWTA